MADFEPIRQTADEIVRRPEYEREHQTFLERLRELFQWEASSEPAPVEAPQPAAPPESLGLGPVATALAYVAITLFVVVLLVTLWRYRSEIRARRTADPKLAPKPERAPVSRPPTEREEWLQRAALAETEGRWDEALICRYEALVRGLVAHRQLIIGPTTTAGEHREQYHRQQENHEHVERFAWASHSYDRVRFGVAAATPDEVRMLELVDRILTSEPSAGDARKPAPARSGQLS